MSIVKSEPVRARVPPAGPIRADTLCSVLVREALHRTAVARVCPEREVKENATVLVGRILLEPTAAGPVEPV